MIEKNIPVPNDNKSNGRKNKSIFYFMDVGDSVFFKGYKTTGDCPQYATAKVITHRTNMRFSGRAVDGGVRVWRIE